MESEWKELVGIFQEYQKFIDHIEKSGQRSPELDAIQKQIHSKWIFAKYIVEETLKLHPELKEQITGNLSQMKNVIQMFRIFSTTP